MQPLLRLSETAASVTWQQCLDILSCQEFVIQESDLEWGASALIY